MPNIFCILNDRMNSGLERNTSVPVFRMPLSACFLLSLAIVSFWFVTADAGEWRLEKSLSGSLIYTDNARLTDAEKRDDLIFNVRPGLRLRGKGRRVDLDLAYSPSINLHTDTRQRNDINHFLDFSSVLDLYQDRYFLDVRANASIVNIVRDLPSSDLALANNNTTQSYRYTIRPNFRHRLKSYGILSGALGYSETRFTESRSSDVATSSVNLRFDETRWINRIDGYVDYNYRNLMREDRSDSFSSVFTTGLVYHINTFWGVTATLGYENGNFEVSDGQTPEGVRWNIGGIWTPSSRVRASASAGRRFFGADYALDVEYRHRRSVVAASYRTSFQTAGGSTLFQGSNFPSLDAFGNPVETPISNQGGRVNGTTPSLSSEVFREDRFDLSWVLRGRRHSLTTRAFYRRREYGESLRDETDTGVSGNITHNLSARSSLFGRATWDILDERDRNREFVRYSLEIGFSRQLGPKTTTRFSVTRRAGDYTDDTPDYTEHRISASISHRF